MHGDGLVECKWRHLPWTHTVYNPVADMAWLWQQWAARPSAQQMLRRTARHTYVYTGHSAMHPYGPNLNPGDLAAGSSTHTSQHPHTCLVCLIYTCCNSAANLSESNTDGHRAQLPPDGQVSSPGQHGRMTPAPAVPMRTRRGSLHAAMHTQQQYMQPHGC